MLILLDRAKLNAGDYLIAERAERLVSHAYPNQDIVRGNASVPLRVQFEESLLCSARAVVIAGGPGYQREMYPRVYPLWDRLDEAKRYPPVVLLALGSSLYPGTDGQLEVFRFSPSAREFLDTVLERSPYLGARDVLTANLLESNGYTRVLMVGDPAWYDLDYLRDRAVQGLRTCGNYDSFAFTPPARPSYWTQATVLLRRIRSEWPRARCVVVSHRDVQPYWRRMANQLECEWIDISGSTGGFRVYDSLDCHVGYRVHAHLYTLSHARPTYLVAEDSRGRGVHESLGMLGTLGYDLRETVASSTVMRIASQLKNSGIRGTGRGAQLLERLGAGTLDGETVSDRVIGQLVQDQQEGFQRHQNAVQRTADTLPTMLEMLRSIPVAAQRS